MIRLKLSIGLRYEVLNQPSDFILNLHAAKTARQKIVSENLNISQPVMLADYADENCGTRFIRFNAQPGPLDIQYHATVDIDHYVAPPACIQETPVAQLPPAVLSYIYPSRYCQSDRLHHFATREFGHLQQGYGRVQAIQDWVRQHIIFTAGSSNASTSAVDTLIEQVGVCRDFAHLMIALCRAVNIPARFVTGIDYGADPALGPTDFHAYVEVFLSNRWYLFDPSGVSPPMGLVRIGTGRDAADVSFATIFGTVRSTVPVVDIEAVEDPGNGFTQPWRCAEALSSIGD